MAKFTDYTEKVTPDDVDIFLLQDSAATKKVSFLNIFNKVKTKLELGLLAKKNTISQEDLEAALLNIINGKLSSSDIVNNLTSTDATKVLSAAQGKVLGDNYSTLNSKLDNGGTGFSKLPDGTYIQFGYFDGSLTTNASRNATRNITFPGTFANTSPVSITVTPANLNYLNGFAIDNIALTGFRAILMGAIAANTAYDSGFRWMAIGRWK